MTTRVIILPLEQGVMFGFTYLIRRSLVTIADFGVLKVPGVMFMTEPELVNFN